jgi:uncharacterized ubiquitin-like protein YukD
MQQSQMNQHQINQQIIQHQLRNQAMMGSGNESGMLSNLDSLDPNSNLLDPKTRHYRKKKTWSMTLKISIETPELDHKLDETFEIEIGSNQRLKVLHQCILAMVKNLELRELIKKEKMYIYIEGKEPVARKSKSLAEMGVKDGDNLIVTTEMKLPFDEYSDDEDNDGQGMFMDEQYDNLSPSATAQHQ